MKEDVVSVSGILIRLVVALAIGAAASAWIPSVTIMSLLTQATIYAVLATGLGILMRQNGMVSFGHGAFFGVSGYIVGLLLLTRAVPAEAAIAIGVAVVAVCSLLYGLIIVRVPGVAFSMITLAVGQMFYVTAARSRGITGGADGMNVEWPSTLFGLSMSTIVKPAVMFLVCWTVLVIIIAVVALLMRGHFGAVTEATRDNEERARFIGIRTLWPRVAIFALSGFVTAIGGALSAVYTGFVSPESMDMTVSATALMMVVVGGTRAQWGPALGAYVYFMTKDYLGFYVADHWMAIFGIALIVVVVFSPAGVAGWLLALRRRVVAIMPKAVSGGKASRFTSPLTAAGLDRINSDMQSSVIPPT